MATKKMKVGNFEVFCNSFWSQRAEKNKRGAAQSERVTRTQTRRTSRNIKEGTSPLFNQGSPAEIKNLVFKENPGSTEFYESEAYRSNYTNANTS